MLLNPTHKNRFVRLFPAIERRKASVMSDDEALLELASKHLSRHQFLDALRYEPWAVELSEILFKNEIKNKLLSRNLLAELPEELR